MNSLKNNTQKQENQEHPQTSASMDLTKTGKSLPFFSIELK